MFDRFDPDAREAVLHAKDEAARAGKREIGTEHLLLSLLSRPGHASAALKAAGADAGDLREQIAPDHEGPPAPSAAGQSGQSGPEQPGTQHPADDLPMTHRARHAMQLALQATQHLRHRHISSGHLLLGIIEQPDSGAVQALRVAGIQVGALRADVLQRMTSGSGRGIP